MQNYELLKEAVLTSRLLKSIVGLRNHTGSNTTVNYANDWHSKSFVLVIVKLGIHQELLTIFKVVMSIIGHV